MTDIDDKVKEREALVERLRELTIELSPFHADNRDWYKARVRCSCGYWAIRQSHNVPSWRMRQHRRHFSLEPCTELLMVEWHLLKEWGNPDPEYRAAMARTWAENGADRSWFDANKKR